MPRHLTISTPTLNMIDNKKSGTIDVSVIIVNYNTCRLTKECVDSIIVNTKDINYEIIIVDNASEDESKLCFTNDCRVTYIYSNDNIGFGKANNIGVEYAHGRNILFLNSDTLLMNNAIKELSEYLDDHQDVGACGGNLYDLYGNPENSFDRYFPSIYTEVNILLREIPDKILYGRNLHFNYSDNPLPVAYIIGADLMIRRKVLDQVGIFNPEFFLYFEETELCLRIRKNGWDVISLPEAKIIHLAGKSTINVNRLKIFEDSRRIFYRLSYPSGHLKIANFIRKVTYYTKILFSQKEVRNRWKQMESIIIR